MDDSQPILSICTRCRDGREAEYSDVRGGARLAKSILMKMQSRFDISFDLRGIACMSQCKRPCIVAFVQLDVLPICLVILTQKTQLALMHFWTSPPIILKRQKAF